MRLLLHLEYKQKTPRQRSGVPNLFHARSLAIDSLQKTKLFKLHLKTIVT